MNFAVTDSQREIAESVAPFVREHYEFHRRRRRAPQTREEALEHWPDFAELGWLGIGVSEERGGLGLGARDIAVVAAEFGMGLVPEPWIESAVLGTILLERAGGDRHAALLASAIAGETTLTVAHGEGLGLHGIDEVATTARREGETFILSGRKSVVRHAPHADWLLVTALIGSPSTREFALFLVPRDAAGLRLTPYPTLDQRAAAEIELGNVRIPAAHRLDARSDAAALFGECVALAAVAGAAETSAIAQTLARTTAKYLTERKQFGVPLATFQALQHRVADMFMDAEEATALTALALDGIERLDSTDATALVADVKRRIDRLGIAVGHAAIQLHGGMGFSDELIVSHYAKRMQALSHCFLLPLPVVTLEAREA